MQKLKNMEINVNSMLSIKNNFHKYSNIKSILIHGNYKEQQPTFSIVIPTYKRISTLKETLASALNQDYKNYYDIIVCDNNPERDDDTEKFMISIKNERVIYYKNCDNIGMVGNWNRCVELCDGKYLVMIHDDDILFSQFLSKCYKIIKLRDDIDGLYPLRTIWDASKQDKISYNESKDYIYKLNTLDYLQGNSDPPTGVLIKKSSIISLGGFNEDTYPSMDFFFNVMFANTANLYRYNQRLSLYRIGENESMKVNIICSFVEKGIPLIRWIAKQNRIPKFLCNSVLHTFCGNNVDFMMKHAVDEVNSVDFSKYVLPKNKLQRIFDKIVVRLLNIWIFQRKKLFIISNGSNNRR